MVGIGRLGAGRIEKQAILALLVAVVWTVGLFAAAPQCAFAAQTNAEVVMDAQSGRVLWANGAHLALPMASTTKILTAITVLEHLDKDKRVIVDKRAQGVEGSSVYLQTGEQWRVQDLLYGLLLRSGNDCAVQLALSTAGSIEAFAALMNETAYRAGAYHSHFVNPHGLHDSDHYTTAYDLACITAYAMKNPDFCTIVACRSYTFTHCSGEKRVFVNKNKMLAGYEGANGVKTGYTKAAGRCLVSAAKREGMQLICVVLNTYDMWHRSASLMDECFATYRMRCLWQAGQTVAAPYGDKRIVVQSKTSLVYPLSDREADAIRYRYRWDATPDRVGTVEVLLEGKTIAQADLLGA